MRAGTAALAALAAACCVVGPAAIVGGLGVAAGSTLGIVAGALIAVGCLAALLVWRHTSRKRAC
jgi:uncharacterized membrane protein